MSSAPISDSAAEPEFYQAVLKLRRRGSRVYADGRMHLVDGARLSTAELVARAAALRPEPVQLDFGW